MLTKKKMGMRPLSIGLGRPLVALVNSCTRVWTEVRKQGSGQDEEEVAENPAGPNQTIRTILAGEWWEPS